MMHYYFINHTPCKTAFVKNGQTEISKEQYDALVKAIYDFDLTAPEGKRYRLEADGTWSLYNLPVIDPKNEELTAEEAMGIIVGGAV